MTSFLLRDFEPGDQAAVWRLHERALEDAGAFAGSGPWNDDLQDPEAFYLARGGAFVVGFVAGRLVAMGALLPTSRYAGVLKRMRVHPLLQRRGLGSRILRELESRARRRGLRKLRLDTTTLQVAAQRFYEHHGYAEVERRSQGRFVLICYEKSLP